MAPQPSTDRVTLRQGSGQTLRPASGQAVTEAAGPDDLALVRRAQAGDVDAFGDLVERHVASAFRRKLALSAAAAALILIAVFVARRSEPLPQAPGVARGADVHLAPDVRATPPAAPQVTTMSLPSPIARPEPRRRGADVVAGPADAVAPADIAPLTAIAPIAVAAIEQERIAPADIAVRQMDTINEIQIAPLTPPDRR